MSRVKTRNRGIRCPKCGKEIDHLEYYAYELNKAKVSVTDDGYLEYYGWTKDEPDYVCPECRKVLFHSHEEVKRFFGIR